MDRTKNLDIVRSRRGPWDVVVIGGGATGAGCALDAASRGLDVLLLESRDFGKGTSSRSTKLIHGGVRYLRQGNISLVREALRERWLLLKNAPHAVHKLEFVIPCYGQFEKLFYAAGMRIYDLLAGGHAIGASRMLSKAETLERLPGVAVATLTGGVRYFDARFDDCRLLIDILSTAAAYGAVVLNYTHVEDILKDAGRVAGLVFKDGETGEAVTISAKAVINAAGIFADEVRNANKESAGVLTFAQGSHIVLDRRFLPGGQAMMIPKTPDGRVLFCIPWHDRVLVGTTDIPVDAPSVEPKAAGAEIDFILETAGDHLSERPTRDDVLSVFAGIRPLVTKGRARRTASLSRGYELIVDASGLVTITGGKWTTYRRMAEDAVDAAMRVGHLGKRACETSDIPINESKHRAAGGERLHPQFRFNAGDVRVAVQDEMARTLEDVLARRTSALFLNAGAAIEAAPNTADVMAGMLGWGEKRKTSEIENFGRLAAGYLAR